ncbi:MAG: 8-amino-7-oxononanoate synthase [Candidatus Firestonebacteria bacterium RIFOXYC2_FULL_39_67]|nr:MAG: 8-amino-7-oxononanoate synthase [Candidatus Firestonebacteria bacterium RIFOXYC2_FULL_39_67]
MEFVEKYLKEAEKMNLLRKLIKVDNKTPGSITIDGREYSDFSSNDYLGLSRHPKLIEAAVKAAKEYGVGSTSSRLMTGSLKLHHELEEKTALFKFKQASLVLNSGYQANVGLIGALSGGGIVFADKLSHASMIDGMLLSGCRFLRFKHNDMDHLESLLQKEKRGLKNALIITETVFSMDGDVCPLDTLVKIKEKYGVRLFVDEAHATGIFGKNGSGLAEELGLTGRIEYIMGTFSKALGSFGAYIALAEKEKEFLVNTLRSFIYSTALPPSVIAANLAALEVVKEEPERRKALKEKYVSFRKKSSDEGLKVLGVSQIVPVLIGENEEAVKASVYLRSKGYWVTHIRPPTVPEGTARIRISISSSSTEESLNGLIEELKKCKVK